MVNLPYLKSSTVLAALAILGLAAVAAPAAEAAPCYQNPGAAAQACPQGAMRTWEMIYCEKGTCFGLASLVAKEQADARNAVSCIQRVPIGADRCLDDQFADPLGHNLDRFAQNTYFAIFLAQAWASPAAVAPPQSGVPGVGATVEKADLVLLP